MANRSQSLARTLGRLRLPGTRRLSGTSSNGSRASYGRFNRRGMSELRQTMSGTGGIRVRREAGEWLRTRMVSSAIRVVAVCSGALGLLAGVALAGVAGWRSVALPVLCVVGATVYLTRRLETRGFNRLFKGAAAERDVGGSIEYALTAPGCAIAHSVTAIAAIGDIDHLAATPGTLWVVETKYRMVPRDRFREVLRRIVVNVEAVRRWAPIGVSVRGCLVLAAETDLPLKRLYDNGQVEVFDPRTLAGKLNQESNRRASDEDLSIARRVWELSGEELV